LRVKQAAVAALSGYGGSPVAGLIRGRFAGAFSVLISLSIF